MNRERVRELLESVRRGETAIDTALERLARLPFVELADARVDTHRALRVGLPEVIFAPGKSPAQIAEIARTLRAAGQHVLATRVTPEVATAVGELEGGGDYEPLARTLWFGPGVVPPIGKGTIAIVSAGTSDAPVVAEADSVARRFGNKTEVVQDAGVAALLGMLTSCASNVSVVNIDNGFGAAYVATLINRL